jgi:hypothetical protein
MSVGDWIIEARKRWREDEAHGRCDVRRRPGLMLFATTTIALLAIVERLVAG